MTTGPFAMSLRPAERRLPRILARMSTSHVAYLPAALRDIGDTLQPFYAQLPFVTNRLAID